MLWSTAFLIDWWNGRVSHCAGKWGNELVSDRFAKLKKPQFYKKKYNETRTAEGESFSLFPNITQDTWTSANLDITLYIFTTVSPS